MLPEIIPTANPVTRFSITQEFNRHHINIMTCHKVIEFSGKGVKVVTDNEGKEKEIPANTIVLAFGMEPERGLSKSICDKYPKAIPMGDCVSMGQVGEAVRRGFFAGWGIQ
jgi:NADH dehydrogenase FAD-containing subunit